MNTNITNDKNLMADLEIEMISDMYHRMTDACMTKCIPKKHKEADLTKGESVCIDRCAAKYMEIHENIGKKLTQMSMQDQELMQKLQAQQEITK
ncbi:unnamed protein product [Gordionus sp. m RMFG-2023]